MQDDRGLPRGSKVLTVVTLVVFLQVLVVAAFGLTAIARDREDARETAREGAKAEARGVVQEVVQGAWREVGNLLDAAAQAASAEDLSTVLRGGMATAVYLVDPRTREVLWVDGEHRLHVPEEVRREMIERQAQDADADRIARLEQSPDPEDRETLVHEYPFRFAADGYPLSVGAARLLLERTTAAVAEDESIGSVRPGAYSRLSRAVLTALEAATLNAGLVRPIYQASIQWIERAVDEAPEVLSPERGGNRLRAEIAAYRAARAGLKEAGGTLEAAVLGATAPPADSKILKPYAQLIGVTKSLVRMDRTTVVLLDQNEVRGLVERLADPQRLERLGVQLRVVASDAPVASATVASQTVGRREVILPFRADLVQVREPVLPTEGPSEWFYWGIIASAAGGLGLGGAFLIRLWRREVHLARLKADFVSNLSHELKTPLTSIGMFTEMLREGKLTSPGDREEAYQVIAQESERLQRIVMRMIDTARRQTQGVRHDLRLGDLNRPVRESVLRMRRIVTEPGLDLTLSLSPEPLPVRMDEAAVDDVVTNLLSNAWKYRRGDRVRIVVRTSRVGRRAEVVVQDDGVGIPKRERRRVFEMFYRAEALLTRAVPGTGLGLALVRTIVRAHRGRVRIESGDGGVGTRFRVRLPLVRGRPEPAAPVERTAAPREPTEAKAS